MRLVATTASFALALALAGCDQSHIRCPGFDYDDVRMRCVCPEGSLELDDGACMFPDGGIVYPPGVDAGPRTDAGTDAGPDLIDGGSDGGVDACELRTYYADNDGDGDGDPATATRACSMPAGFVDNDDDCDDACMACRPGGTEVCDELDNDCDDSTDEDVLSLYFRDADGDTFGNPAMPMQACSMPVGFVDNDDDCDDACMTCRPGGTEVCDIEMRDENCMGGGNEGCSCADGMTRACPGGSDVGECVAGTQTCAGGAWGACMGAVGPSAEACNGRDDDCDMAIDGAAAATACEAAPRATARGCTAGECVITSCVAGYDDCDGTYANGCEANLATSRTTCGDCTTGCGWGCYGGLCNDATVLATSAHANHACALREDSTVVCWGQNSSGQVGDGATMDRYSPAVVVGLGGSGVLRNVAEIVVGGDFSCARLVDGSVACWGSDVNGRLGDGTGVSTRAYPALVPGLTGVAEISAGSDYACVRLEAGGVRCWGGNASRQLGDGSTTTRYAPVPASVLSGLRTTQLATGSSFACALISDGAVRCWGSNLEGTLGDGTTMPRTDASTVTGLGGAVTTIAAGASHACALLSGNQLQCWGSNGTGQIGDGSTTRRPSPTASTLTGVTSVSLGALHSCARTSDGLYCWGRGVEGQLGDGRGADSSRPTLVPDITSTEVSAGSRMTCSRDAADIVECWGRGQFGQLGNGSTTDPVLVPTPMAAPTL